RALRPRARQPATSVPFPQPAGATTSVSGSTLTWRRRSCRRSRRAVWCRRSGLNSLVVITDSETPAATPTALSLRHAPVPRTRDPELDKSNPRPGRLDTPTVGVCVAGPDPCPRCRSVLQAPAHPGQNAVTDLGASLLLA